MACFIAASLAASVCAAPSVTLEKAGRNAIIAASVFLIPAMSDAAGLLYCKDTTQDATQLGVLDGGIAYAATVRPQGSLKVLVLASNPYFICWEPGGAHIIAAAIAVVTLVVAAVGAGALCVLVRRDAWLIKALRILAEEEQRGRLQRRAGGRGSCIVTLFHRCNTCRGVIRDGRDQTPRTELANMAPGDNYRAHAQPIAQASNTDSCAVLVDPILGLYRPQNWYTRFIDWKLAAYLVVVQVLLPRPDTIALLAVKAALVIVPTCTVALYFLIVSPYKSEHAWMGWVRSNLLFAAACCALVNGVSAAADIDKASNESSNRKALNVGIFTASAFVLLFLSVAVVVSIRGVGKSMVNCAKDQKDQIVADAAAATPGHSGIGIIRRVGESMRNVWSARERLSAEATRSRSQRVLADSPHTSAVEEPSFRASNPMAVLRSISGRTSPPSRPCPTLLTQNMSSGSADEPAPRRLVYATENVDGFCTINNPLRVTKTFIKITSAARDDDAPTHGPPARPRQVTARTFGVLLRVTCVGCDEPTCGVCRNPATQRIREILHALQTAMQPESLHLLAAMSACADLSNALRSDVLLPRTVLEDAMKSAVELLQASPLQPGVPALACEVLRAGIDFIAAIDQGRHRRRHEAIRGIAATEVGTTRNADLAALSGALDCFRVEYSAGSARAEGDRANSMASLAASALTAVFGALCAKAEHMGAVAWIQEDEDQLSAFASDSTPKVIIKTLRALSDAPLLAPAAKGALEAGLKAAANMTLDSASQAKFIDADGVTLLTGLLCNLTTDLAQPRAAASVMHIVDALRNMSSKRLEEAPTLIAAEIVPLLAQTFRWVTTLRRDAAGRRLQAACQDDSTLIDENTLIEITDLIFAALLNLSRDRASASDFAAAGGYEHLASLVSQRAELQQRSCL